MSRLAGGKFAISGKTRTILRCPSDRGLFGEVSERFIVLVLKTRERKSSVGSNPTLSSKLFICDNMSRFGGLAQLVERLTVNQNVVGSTPTSTATNLLYVVFCGAAFLRDISPVFY